MVKTYLHLVWTETVGCFERFTAMTGVIVAMLTTFPAMLFFRFGLSLSWTEAAVWGIALALSIIATAIVLFIAPYRVWKKPASQIKEWEEQGDITLLDLANMAVDKYGWDFTNDWHAWDFNNLIHDGASREKYAVLGRECMDGLRHTNRSSYRLQKIDPKEWTAPTTKTNFSPFVFEKGDNFEFCVSLPRHRLSNLAMRDLNLHPKGTAIHWLDAMTEQYRGSMERRHEIDQADRQMVDENDGQEAESADIDTPEGAGKERD